MTKKLTPEELIANMICPECGRDNFKAPTALGRHRSTAHGVQGSSSSSIAYRASKARKLAKENEPTALAVHPKRHVQQQPEPLQLTVQRGRSRKEVHLGENNSPTSEQETLIALAIGRLEAQCHQLAFENGIPAKQFTRWVAGYFQLQASR